MSENEANENCKIRSDICSICNCELESDVIELECCRGHLHRECFIASLEAFDFKRLVCPLCHEPLSYSTLATLSPKQMEICIQLKAERACSEFFRTKTELINRYKLLIQIINQFPYALELIQMHQELEELKRQYCDYKGWRIFDSESVSCTEEANERIEEFDMTTKLVRLTSKAESNNSALFVSLIEAAKNDVFVFQSNIVLNEVEFELIKSMLKSIESSATFKLLTSFQYRELEIIKNEDKKSSITVLYQLEQLYQQKSTIAICRCECGGVIRDNGEHAYCDVCFQQYCNQCFRKQTSSLSERSSGSIHECKREDVLSAIALRNQYRACPNCGLLIDRTIGTCEHMFCTDCFCGFDWNTRAFITSNFVNPHRDKWIELLGERRVDYMDAIEIHSDELKASLNDARVQMYASKIGYEELLNFVKLSSELSSKYISALEKKLLIKLKIEESKRVKYHQRSYFVAKEIERMLKRFNDKVLSILNAGISIASSNESEQTEFGKHSEQTEFGKHSEQTEFGKHSEEVTSAPKPSESSAVIRALNQAIIDFNKELNDFSVFSANTTLLTVLYRRRDCLNLLNSISAKLDLSFD